MRMEDQKRENRIGCASKVLIAVAVVASVAVTVERFKVALILSLVDPIDDVLVAMLRRCLSAIASEPTAGRVLSPQPL